MASKKTLTLHDLAALGAGGASGIGASFVRAFVENGAKVAFLDLQRETGAALANSLGEIRALRSHRLCLRRS